MFRTATLAVVATLACAGLSRAQFSQPGPEHERLKEQVGTWDVVMSFGGQESKGSSTYKSVCGGMWMVSDFQGEFGGMAFQGHGIDGYDQQKKKYVGIWCDSMTSAPCAWKATTTPRPRCW